MATIRCHTVPQFYLNYFLPENSKTFLVYDKERDEHRLQSPINTTVVGDYYLSEEDAAGKKDKRMELFLSEIEGKAKTILDRICQKPSALKEDEIHDLAIFLAFAFCRVPRSVSAVKEINAAGLERILEIMSEESQYKEKLQELYDKVAKGKSDIPIEQFKELCENPLKFFKFEINEKHALGDSFSMVSPLYACLMNMNWAVRLIKNKNFFVTSDAPVNVFLPLNNGKVIFGGGFGMPGVQVMFPVNPRTCLFLTYKPLTPFKSIDAEFVHEMNKRTVRMAEKYIISPYKSNKISRLIKEVGDTFSKSKLDKNYLRERFKQKIKLNN